MGEIFFLLTLLGLTMKSEAVYPGATWETKSPAEVGLDAEALKAFRDIVGGRGCVVRHGYLVFTWGDVARRGDIASAAKPIYTHFLLRALEEGRISSLDEPVLRYEPRLADLNPNLGHKDRAITWRHLATQTACYGVSESPGTAFCYNDWQMALFWDLLFLKVWGSSYERVDEEVFHPKLTNPLQCEDAPTLMAFGTVRRPGRVAISPRDFARFGLLYLRRGCWNGQPLLRPEHVLLATTSPLPNSMPRSAGQAAAMLPGQRSIGSERVPDNQTDHLGSYSFLWWTNGVDREGRRHWPGAPLDTYGAFGHWGRRVLVVIPSLDLVVSWNDSPIAERDREGQALRTLAGAVVR